MPWEVSHVLGNRRRDPVPRPCVHARADDLEERSPLDVLPRDLLPGPLDLRRDHAAAHNARLNAQHERSPPRRASLVAVAEASPQGYSTILVTWFVALTAAPVSLTTWSMPPAPLRKTVRMSWSFTPDVTGTSKACAEWIGWFWLKKL